VDTLVVQYAEEELREKIIFVVIVVRHWIGHLIRHNEKHI